MRDHGGRISSKSIGSKWILFLLSCTVVVAILALAIPLRSQQCCLPDFCDGCVSGGGLCDQASCTCKYKTPIIIDVSGTGYHLTSAADGVMFRFAPGLPLTPGRLDRRPSATMPFLPWIAMAMASSTTVRSYLAALLPSPGPLIRMASLLSRNMTSRKMVATETASSIAMTQYSRSYCFGRTSITTESPSPRSCHPYPLSVSIPSH